MISGQPKPDARSRGRRWAMVFVVMCAVVFGLGALLGYNSIYRNISVAMVAPPPGSVALAP